ncbi:MAG: ATP-binding protein [Pseudomonadota bacterium]
MQQAPDHGPASASPPAPVYGLEVNYHAMLAHSPDAVVLVDIDSGRLIDANLKAEAMFGVSGPALLGHSLADLCPPQQGGGQAPTQLLADYFVRVREGDTVAPTITFLNGAGRAFAGELRMVRLPVPGRRLMHVRIVDVTARSLAEALAEGQSRLLEMIALGSPLNATLDQLMLLIEAQSQGVLCSVVLLDEDGETLRPASGPHLPPAYMASLDGLKIGPQAGSCGTAMFRKDVVVVSDIMGDPLWQGYTGLVAPYGLRACWSTPIHVGKGQVLGSFAMYYRERRSPGPDDMRLIGVATHLAGIAIERTRRERELARHREHLEELVGERTAELTRAKEHTERINHELESTLVTLSATQNELVRRDKLAALGSLVAGVAHELNTPLGNSLVVATTMAERARVLSADLVHGLRRSTLDLYLAQAEEAGKLLVRNLQRAANLVAAFKQIGVDQSSSQRRKFMLGDLLAELLPPFRVSARQRPIEVLSTSEPALAMDSYPGPLTEVVSNLFDNCLLHAFEGERGGTIRITAARRPDGWLALSVQDDGAGIAPEFAARVYDPFYTTKLGLGGSGLGLHVAHNIVTGVLGGRIELQSERGKGSTFTLVLPPVAPQFDEAPQTAGPKTDAMADTKAHPTRLAGDY